MSNLIDEIQPRLLVMILIGILIVGVFGAYRFLFKTDMVEFDRLRQLRTDSEVDVASEEGRVSDYRAASLEQQINTLNNRLFGKGLDLPAGQMVSHIIGQLDRLSDQHGVQLIAVKPGERSVVLSFTEVPFDVEVGGVYFDLFAWLEAAEIELRPMVVKQFQLSPGPEDALLMSLRVVSYRSPSRPGCRSSNSVASLLILGLITGLAGAEIPDTQNTASILHRDPFKQPKLLEEPEKPDEPDVSTIIKVPPPWTRELRATMVAGQASMANVDGVLVTLGEQLDGFTLVEVRERSAVFERDTVRRVLTIN